MLFYAVSKLNDFYTKFLCRYLPLFFKHPFMSLFSQISISAHLLNKSSHDEILGAFSQHGFELDGHYWPSAEHYYQASKFSQTKHRERIALASTPEEAVKLGHQWFKRKNKHWKQQRVLMMTRAMYSKCMNHEEVKQALLDTEDIPLSAADNFDYFWGCGRDGRGENQFGKLMERIRSKIRTDEQTTENKNAMS